MHNKIKTLSDPDTGNEYFQLAIDGFIFTWHGGAYVDIAIGDVPDQAFDCVNVWDYETSAPTITVEGLVSVAREWITDNLPDWRDTGALHDHVAYYSNFSTNK